jgi:hypothetical protein
MGQGRRRQGILLVLAIRPNVGEIRKQRWLGSSIDSEEHKRGLV